MEEWTLSTFLRDITGANESWGIVLILLFFLYIVICTHMKILAPINVEKYEEIPV